MAGAISNDRKLAAEVRRLGLGKVKRLFEMDDDKMSDKEKDMHDELLKRMAPNFVPRLTEITGEDGEALQINIVKYGDPITVSVPAEELPDTTTESV